MVDPNKILSDLIVNTKYARYLPHKKRRETFEELVERTRAMHSIKLMMSKVPEGTLNNITKAILSRRLLPSMRGMQFGGAAVEQNHTRIYNCAYRPVDSVSFFQECMFLLLGGTGLGYSVQYRHVEQLPKVIGFRGGSRKFKIGDSIEGWADAIKVEMEAHFYGKREPVFDFSGIREKGAELVTAGGKAPGPAPLRECLVKIREVMEGAKGRKLRPFEAHLIACHIADAVLSGGIRRAAMISLFSYEDVEMMTCKSGNWWEKFPELGRSNNSVVFHRQHTTQDMFYDVMKRCEESRAGEPGVVWVDDYNYGYNPCGEVYLRPYQFCNLVDINASAVETKDDLKEICTLAGHLATIQASYTDFHYLGSKWKETTEEDALIGVGMTGLASMKVEAEDMLEAATFVKEANKEMSEWLGISPAKRCTTVKPAGTTSLVLGTSSGIHAWHSPYYIRRIRLGKDEAIYHFLLKHIPDLIEDCVEKPHLQAVVSFPQKAPEGAVTREEESTLDFLKRIMSVNRTWIEGGSNDGGITRNNVSATVSVKDEEWTMVAEFLWDAHKEYSGISLLPYDGHTYRQAPFEACTKEVYEEMCKHLHNVDFSTMVEEEDGTNLAGEVACGGGACEVSFA